MHIDKKLKLIKFFGDKWNGHQDRVKRSVLGDIVFTRHVGKCLIYNASEFTFSMWENIRGFSVEKFRSNVTPTNREIFDWCNRLTHNRWAQMRKLSRMKSKYQWDR